MLVPPSFPVHTGKRRTIGCSSRCWLFQPGYEERLAPVPAGGVEVQEVKDEVDEVREEEEGEMANIYKTDGEMANTYMTDMLHFTSCSSRFNCSNTHYHKSNGLHRCL